MFLKRGKCIHSHVIGLKRNLLSSLLFLIASGLYGQSFVLASNNKTILCDSAANGATGVVNGKTYTKVNRTQLVAKIAANEDVSCVCTSGITNMSGLFQNNQTFNQDISSWDTSDVNNMMGLFQNAGSFNQDIGYWDISSMNDQNGVNQLFDNAGSLNQDLSYWCFPSGGSASNIYQNRQNIWGNNNPIKNNSSLRPRFAIAGNCISAKVGPPVSSGNSEATLTLTSSDSDNIITSGVVTLTAAFSENMAATPLISIAGLVTNTAMTQGSSAAEWTYYWPIPSSVTTGTYAVTVAATDTTSLAYDGSASLNLGIYPMFYLDSNGVTIKCSGCSAGDTGYVGGVLYTVYDNASLRAKSLNDSDWGGVVTTLVTDMSDLFYGNGVIEGNNLHNFFNSNDITSWDTSNVTNFHGMLQLENVDGSFNQNISHWDTSSATDMSHMFWNQKVFNQDIGSWDTSNVTNMRYMFNHANAFNNGAAAGVSSNTLNW
ncbi:MAG: BspA family leucine-rich repeat surface protein, partial [Flavobacteriaceae bacterium]